MELTHKNLCDLAVRWLQRPNSRNGHGCCFAVSEVATGYAGEIPDAIGFRASEWDCAGSVLVEVKTSRSDFLADKKKAHRIEGGVGDWRYYMAPTGLIQIDELPPQWGLVEVNGRGHINVVHGPAKVAKNFMSYRSQLEEFKHDANKSREFFLLVKLLTRLGNPEELNQRLRKFYRDVNSI
ncbi:hypothetical protein ADP71_31570 [Vitreoscilla sp. C1]|uniref:adenylosuccinate synthase n=1 Tax=Vitreoscilla sp. (strain C1) TaxID=96942 RepID=UPI00148E96ED|nr:adenylosuccinate synthase [Vitreoscilla sp. C1]AUZ06335.2 hypothetical protein ADP71_31570 [Vitreoscilla sp. C1]